MSLKRTTRDIKIKNPCMMTRTMRKVISRLLLVKLVFALFLFVQGYWYWLLNFELAFFASMFIIIG
jgi:hypothetical protein